MASRPEVVYHNKASSELDSIIHQIKFKSGKAYATKLYRAYLKKLEEAQRYPDSGQLYLPARNTIKKVYRRKTFAKRYKFIYRSIEDGNALRIIAIRSVKMDDGPIIQRIEEE